MSNELRAFWAQSQSVSLQFETIKILHRIYLPRYVPVHPQMVTFLGPGEYTQSKGSYPLNSFVSQLLATYTNYSYIIRIEKLIELGSHIFSRHKAMVIIPRPTCPPQTQPPPLDRLRSDSKETAIVDFNLALLLPPYINVT